MSRFRLILAWLLMAALPLQGMAAASMLFCGSATAARIAKSSGHGSHHQAATPKHDHAAHGHAVPDAGRAASDATSAEGASGDLKVKTSQNGHACPICASCCQAGAVGGFAAFPQLSAPPGIEPAHPLVRVVSRTTHLPDKPPRA